MSRPASADLSDFGPFPVGNTTVTVTRPNGSTFTALLYYPATSNGLNATLDQTSAPYSAISFGHGFLQNPNRYIRTMSHLASYGHIVIASNSETGLFPSHSNFASDMRSTLTYLELRNGNPADSFFGKVDVSNFGLFGHSMGGGAGLLATAADPRIKAYVGLAAAITNPSPVPLMPNLRVPVAMLTGNQDGIVNYQTNSVSMFNAGVAPKILPLIEGGFHVGFQDDPYPIFPDSGSIPQQQQLAITRAYLTSFFGLYLRKEQSLWSRVWGPEAFGSAELPTQAVSGIELSTTQSQQTGQAGSSMIYSLTLTNTGPVANQFSFFTEENAWSVSFAANPTPVVQPGQQFTTQVTVEIPSNATEGQTDMVQLSARSEADQGTRRYLYLTTEAIAQPVFVGGHLYHATFTGTGHGAWNKVDPSKAVIELDQANQLVGLDNISTSSTGINGLVVDIANLTGLSDLTFETYISPTGAFSEDENALESWLPAPAASSVSFHPGEGIQGSGRILLLWPDGSIANRYLNIRLFHLGAPVCNLVIGHLTGELTGPDGGVFTVSFSDIAQVRSEVGSTVDAGSSHDVDKSGVVSFADISAMRTNIGTQLTQLTLVSSASR